MLSFLNAVESFRGWVSVRGFQDLLHAKVPQPDRERSASAFTASSVSLRQLDTSMLVSPGQCAATACTASSVNWATPIALPSARHRCTATGL